MITNENELESVSGPIRRGIDSLCEGFEDDSEMVMCTQVMKSNLLEIKRIYVRKMKQLKPI